MEIEQLVKVEVILTTSQCVHLLQDHLLAD